MRLGVIDLPFVDPHMEVRSGLDSPPKGGGHGRGNSDATRGGGATLLLTVPKGGTDCAEPQHLELLEAQLENLSHHAKTALLCRNRATMISKAYGRLVSSASKASAYTSISLVKEDVKELRRLFGFVDVLLHSLGEEHMLDARMGELYKAYCHALDIAFRLLTLERTYAIMKRSFVASYDEARRVDGEHLQALANSWKRSAADSAFVRPPALKTEKFNAIDMLLSTLTSFHNECLAPHRALLRNDIIHQINIVKEIRDRSILLDGVDLFF